MLLKDITENIEGTQSAFCERRNKHMNLLESTKMSTYA